MAVAYDATGTGAGTTASAASLSWSHTATGSKRAVVVGFAVGTVANAGSGWTRSVTYNGVAMTSFGMIDSGVGQVDGFIELFGLLNPATGSQTVVASATKASVTPESLIACSVSYTGVGWFGTGVTGANAGQANAPSLVVPSEVGSMAVGAMCSGSAVAGNTQTQRYRNNLIGNTAAGNLVVSDGVGAATVTFTANANSDWWGWVGVDLHAAAQMSGAKGLTTAVRRAAFY